MLRRVVWQKFTDVPDVFAASIIRAMNTHRPDSHRHTRRRENLKSLQKKSRFIIFLFHIQYK
jgi:hypothetical protein